MILHNFFNFLKKQFHTKILKRKYYRFGTCNKCGSCCQNIYVRHKDNIIKTEEEFQKIQDNETYPFYQHIKVIGKDDFGLIFECEKFDKEKKLCKQHNKRPDICRKYPSEEIFKMGACLKEGCGYYFEPIEKFSEVFARINKKPVKDFEIYRD